VLTKFDVRSLPIPEIIRQSLDAPVLPFLQNFNSFVRMDDGPCECWPNLKPVALPVPGSGGFRLGPGGTAPPPNLAQAPQIFDWFQGCIGVYRRTRVGLYAVYQPLVFFDSV